jgi:hypothetical protein
MKGFFKHFVVSEADFLEVKTKLDGKSSAYVCYLTWLEW